MRAPRGQRRLVALACHRCGRDYFVPPWRAQKSRFCSRACTRLNKRCLRCNAPIIRRPGRRRFCSRKCSDKWLRGPRSATWKGGRPRNRRNVVKQRAWSRAVLKRDGFRCQTCGGRENLHAHHIRPFSVYPRLRYAISNGKTLCLACHSAVHGFKPMGRRGRTCVGCGKPCSGKSQGPPRCLSCAIKHWHALGRPSPQENTERFRQQALPL